jgi:psiF repeat
MHMTKTTGIVAVSLFVFGLGIAPFASAAPAKQSKMAACNAQADDKGLGEGKEEERKVFMKECLSAKTAKAMKTGGTQQNNQQSKMKSCNTEAGTKGLKGDERKTFMSACLSN